MERKIKTINSKEDANKLEKSESYIDLIPCENATEAVRVLFGDWIGPVVGECKRNLFMNVTCTQVLFQLFLCR